MTWDALQVAVHHSCQLFLVLFSLDCVPEMHGLIVLLVSPYWKEDIGESDDEKDDDDDKSEGRYDRRQNTRDANDLQLSLRQRLVTSQSVFSLLCYSFKGQEVESLAVRYRFVFMK